MNARELRRVIQEAKRPGIDPGQALRWRINFEKERSGKRKSSSSLPFGAL
jgi:hypothetical protein